MDQVFLVKFPFKSKRVESDEQLDRLLNSHDFAKQFHIVERTAYQWARVGKVWATKIGSRWYFDPLSVKQEE
ncbi:hypothetical protein ACKFKG_03205 [Phormidesmis sp. 146-35]